MWTRIPDDRVRHIWADPDGSNETTVPPTFYAESGTPICDDDSEFSGDDMVYVGTEVQLPGVQLPGVQQPGVQLPGVQQPGVQQPGVQQPELAEATALLEQVTRCARFNMPHGITAYAISDEVMGKIRAFVEQRKSTCPA